MTLSFKKKFFKFFTKVKEDKDIIFDALPFIFMQAIANAHVSLFVQIK